MPTPKSNGVFWPPPEWSARFDAPWRWGCPIGRHQSAPRSGRNHPAIPWGSQESGRPLGWEILVGALKRYQRDTAKIYNWRSGKRAPSLSLSLSLCCCFVFVPILKYVKETWGQWIRGDMLIFYDYHFIFVENDELTYMLGAECSWQMGVCDNAQQTAEGPFQINITNLQQCLLGFNGQNWLTCAETFQYLPWMAVFWAVTHLVRSTSGISRPHHCQKTISLTVIQGIPRCCGGHIGQWQHENAIVIAIHSPQSIFAVDAHGIHATSLNQQLSTLIDWI